MVRALPEFKGWTVDERLREFRKVTYDIHGNPKIEYLSFDSEKGKQLYREYMRTAREEEKSNIDRSFEQQDLCHEIAELASGVRHLQYDVHQVVVNPESKEEWNVNINDVQRKILELQNSIEELKKVSSCKYSY